MTPQEYIDDHEVKPLTPQEIKKGKKSLRIYGTDDPMPWDEIYTRISAGMSMKEIAHIYGHGRKIALWAQRDKISTTEEMSNLLDDEIVQRKKMAALEEASPTAAKTIMEMANEYAPDATKNIALFGNKLIHKAANALDKDKLTSLDMVNLSKAVMTVSDTLGHTQRHANAAAVTHNQIQVEGFAFHMGTPPAPSLPTTPTTTTTTDAEVIE